jgi:hypothetical protein
MCGKEQARGKRQCAPSLCAPKEMCQPACKPGSVWPGACAPNVAAIHLGTALPPSSCNLPGHSQPEWPAKVSPGAVSLFGLAPGGACHAACVAARAVGSYPTFSPLPNRLGGSISVALSLRLPPPAINRRRYSVEPGLSSLPAFRQMGSAAARPAGPALKRGQLEKGKEKLQPRILAFTLAQYLADVGFIRLA